MDLKAQAYGVEIEMTGITRGEASRALAGFFHSQIEAEGDVYDTRKVRDSEGRSWKIVSDSSIQAERKKPGSKEYENIADSRYRVEFVTPKLEYKDMETLQEAVRVLRKAGAVVNNSCGIHVHVDASNHNAKSLKNILNIVASKEDLLFKALKVERWREVNYCSKVSNKILNQINDKKKKINDLGDLCSIWYEGNPSRQHKHYDPSRYRALNLHAVWYKGTVEFRCFNSSLHAGEVKSYVQLALAISAQAINQKSASPVKTQTENEKFTFRTWLLRLGMIGEEFETARGHLLKNLDGDSAWRYDKSSYACNQRPAQAQTIPEDQIAYDPLGNVMGA